MRIEYIKISALFKVKVIKVQTTTRAVNGNFTAGQIGLSPSRSQLL
jgi:hypothetical protein